HIPLLFRIGAEREIFRLSDKQAPEPFVRRSLFRYLWRANVKAFRGLSKHSRGRPLLGPEPNFRERTFIAPGTFAEQATLPLRMNGAGENFYSWNPDRSYFWKSAIGSGNRARVETRFRKLSRELSLPVFSCFECAPRFRGEAMPKFGLWFHSPNEKSA